MSWAKIDDRAHENDKQMAAGAEACWFWACGLMYANRKKKRDGKIPEAALPTLYGPLAAKAKKLAGKLVEVGLWHKVGADYLIHDYHSWNPTTEQVEAEKEAGRRRAKESYERRKRESSPEEKEHSSGEDTAPSSPDSSGSTPTPTPKPEEKESPSPSGPGLNGAKRPDPMGDSLRGRAPEQRADVAEVFERFKQAIGKPLLKFRAPYDTGAKAIAVAIDTDGLKNCLIVADFCMNDGMVNGKQDEQRLAHDTPEYVFGKNHIFHRILKAALAAGKGTDAPPKRSARDAVAAAKAIGSGA